MTDPADEQRPDLHPVLEVAVERFELWCRARLLSEELKNPVEQPLYHYTSAMGLKGIFDTRQIWFTDYRHLNDPSELRLGVERAHEALSAAAASAGGRERLFLDNTADLLTQENLDLLGYFVSSFSRARNDLGQWRAYADNGRGFAIGYAPSMFAITDDLKASPDENAILGPVVYDADGALNRHRLPIDKAASLFLETANANIELLREREIGEPFMRELSLRLIASALIWNSLTTKHPAYDREQEVRMVIMGTANDLLPVTKTRVRGGEIVPYIAHPWAVSGPEDIAEIVVGPAAPPDAERTLLTLLATHGIAGVKIERSDIPYRAL